MSVWDVASGGVFVLDPAGPPGVRRIVFEDGVELRLGQVLERLRRVRRRRRTRLRRRRPELLSDAEAALAVTREAAVIALNER